MFRNYLKIALRHLLKNKANSWINIAGLATGLAVVLLIGLWIDDELSYDHYHRNHNKIVQAYQQQNNNGKIRTSTAIPYPIGAELRKTYGSDFKYVVMSSWVWDHILSYENKTVVESGSYMESDAPKMLSLSIKAGTQNGLSDPSSIMLSQTAAKGLFGNDDPLGKIVKLDNKLPLKVTGVYEDLPYNTTLSDISFVVPWDLYPMAEDWIKGSMTNWSNNSFQLYAQLADNADPGKVAARIRDVKLKQLGPDEKKYSPAILLLPMNDWHLRSQFKNGIQTGGRVRFVWMFGIIGGFVLLLACINFMNLSTARSEKRAKEVGIRKSIGSLRTQLITQFLGESLVVSFISMFLAILLAQAALPFFNDVADKKMVIPWSSVYFWMIAIGVALITGMLAGSYPALYLSSFKPIKVLKGTWRAGRYAAMPRKVLVVLQFSVSIILIIGTIVVFRQIQFAKDRPVGYNQDRLLILPTMTPDLNQHFDVVYDELKKNGTISSMAASGSKATEVNSNGSGFDWEGKDPNMAESFAVIGVTTEYGKTVDWQLTQGRDFSKNMLTDSNAVIMNETAVTYMGLKDPVGKTIRWDDRRYTIVGVIKDMLMQSPYEPVKQTFYFIDRDPGEYLHLRLNPGISTKDALANIEAVSKKYSPAAPFNYLFVDDEYGRKFASEERIGKLAGFFTILAIFICCLGLFGMASFMAEQRVKEIGVRKVLGASVFGLWQLLSRDFVVLVLISILIATPVGYYFMKNWLEDFNYKTSLSIWIFLAAGAGALAITILTVSYQSIKAAMANPVKSLKVE
ncbi:MAG: ABC transporter permease [Citrobacter freundii]|nr:MAG: ABC transporter permease [Citrobacter freundii]